MNNAPWHHNRKGYSEQFRNYWRREFRAQAKSKKIEPFEAVLDGFLELHEEMIHWWRKAVEKSENASKAKAISAASGSKSSKLL
jgi:hypothetical protein